MESKGRPASKNQKNSLVTAYLVAYNVAQILGWSALGILLINHLVKKGTYVGLYHDVSVLLYIFQTAAVLEVLNCAVGFVKSNVVLTGFQVFSRVFLTWGIAYSVPSVQNNIGVCMFLSAWTLTEVIRYSFYLFALIGEVPYIIQWCRYTFFIILYPVGVTGELLSIYGSLNEVVEKKLYYLELPNRANIAFNFYYYLIFTMLMYIPIFPQLYFHMVAQRKKVIGGRTKSD
ncbi:very-long-chain (3R)-3-hydroxyacyl-CoA dehydratase 2-like [Mytilus trossulus]|uniref:very-long-chain (3R)-3-hydroxyacyl-CoA dehydratase 2-like n=1 Tax=Mytilus trossulus TaxID=6551 RepID=UPI00300721CA